MGRWVRHAVEELPPRQGQVIAMRDIVGFTAEELVDTDQDAAFQRFRYPLAEHFDPEEMLEIVAVVVNINVSTRIKLAEGAIPGPAD